MASFLNKIKPIIVPPTGRHTASAICLHGSGDEGVSFLEWIVAESGAKFTFPHIRLIVPTAPYRRYTPALGQPSRVWFDRQQISPFGSEDFDSIQESCDQVRQILEAEMEAGIPAERIIVGGFSMGGALALYYGLRCGLDLAGVFALSAFLGEKSVVYDDLEEDPGPRPPLFQAHGVRDPLVRFEWGERTHQRLKALGVAGEFHSFPNVFHELNKKELLLLHSWINSRLPNT